MLLNLLDYYCNFTIRFFLMYISKFIVRGNFHYRVACKSEREEISNQKKSDMNEG